MLTRNWALIGAGVIGTGIAVFVLWRSYVDSAPGRLRSKVRELRGRYADLVTAGKRVRRAQRRLESLRGRGESVKPRRITEAGGELEDAQALLKIAQDQVLIAENHVRKVIVEEFPPKRQEALRTRYLTRPTDQGKPFIFG